MKIRVITFLAFVLAGFLMSKAQQDANPNVVRCYTMEADAELRHQHPELGTLDEFEAWLAPRVADYKANGNRVGAVTTIPVIFHIIHNGDAVGSGENISATYVNAQLDQLNNDFRRILGTSGYNTNPVGADTELEFCLATLDENGNTLSEPGINRVQTSSSSYNQSSMENLKPSTQWDPDQYMNIWVANLSGGLLGYAQFPSQSGLGGLNNNGGAANTDGVVVTYTSVGSTDVPFPGGSPYNEGRTLTHEVGHWVGLRHIWGDSNCGNDFCDDTPTAQGPASGCPNKTTCDGNRDMVENYMDYSYDACMNIFTQDQKARIQTVFANSPRRGILASSDRCGSGGGGGGLTCGTTISSFPYGESFESGLGAWSQGSGDDFNWTRDSGGTPSSGTGPSTGSDGSWYVYVEASSPNYPTKTTILDGPCFDLSGQSQATFTFDFHAQGSAVGTTVLEATTDGSSWAQVWSISGDQGANWNAQSVNLSSYLGSTVKLRFRGTTASSWQGDMAVDNIGLSTSGGGGGGNNCTASVSSYPYSEGFESGTGAWSQAGGDDLDWTRDSGGTPSTGTGPSSGAGSSSWYMYVEASGNGTGYPNKTAIFDGPCFDLSGESSATFTYSYHMYSSAGGSEVGSLDLQASTDDGANWTSLNSISGDQGNAWNNASVNMNAYVGGNVRVRFVAQTAATWRGDIAVDNVGMNESPGGGGGGCTTVDISITFDNYPEETSWTITDASGATVASGGTYGSQPDGSTLNLSECLSAGCYDFNISDSYGDGICCSYGNGSYSVSAGGSVVASGGSFGSSETTNFCVSGNRQANPVQAAAEAFFEDFTLFPNPTRSVLNVGFESSTNGQATVTVTDLAGKIMLRQATDVNQGNNQVTLQVRDFAAGTYLLFLNNENGQISKRFVIMK